MKKVFSLLVAAIFVLSLASAAGAHGDSHYEHDNKYSPWVKKELKRVKEATKKYRNVNKALADGFVNTKEYVYVKGLGGMGVHFVRPDRASDGVVSATKPEALLYMPLKGGGYQLIGVEYIVPAAATKIHPVLFGRKFDGPMLNHDLEPIAHTLKEKQKKLAKNNHYDLHVWLYKHNPAGLFAQFNPDLGPLKK
ncbi:hypothetical protein [Peribacillus sp. SCS-155]|uniref:hypothetical protein n=1 Tax=Peribacillus sedimenti TaxID=3115297 RepID=UPI00390594F3